MNINLCRMSMKALCEGTINKDLKKKWRREPMLSIWQVTANTKPQCKSMFSVFEKEQGAKCGWNRIHEEESDLKSEKEPYHGKSCSLRREFQFFSSCEQKPMGCFE